MAVTIDEMHVQVEAPTPVPKPSEAEAGPKKEIDLKAALEMVHERKLRLRAD